MYDIKDKLRVKNMSDLVRKEIMGIFNTKTLKKNKRKYKRFGKELISGEKGIYIRNDLIQKIIMHCKATNENVKEFRSKLGCK